MNGDTVKLTLHPAFKDTIPLPVAILSHQVLGLGHGQTLYLIHILAAQIRGERPISRRLIAERMGVSLRTLSKYSSQLEGMGILLRVEQFREGRQAENTYDLDRWLSQSLEATYSQQDERLARLLNQLKGIENLDDLRALIGAYSTPLDPTIKGGGDPTIKGGGDPTIKGVPEVDPLDRRIKGIDDDDHINDHNVNGSSSSMITNPMQMLLALRAKRGGRFDRAAAMVVLHKAQQHFGDDAGRVVTAWCQYAAGNSAITNAPGFVRYKVESGEWPPENDDERQAGSYVDRLPEDIRRLIQR